MTSATDPDEFLARTAVVFKRLREVRGLSQKEAAVLLNTNQGRISYLENGSLDIKVSTLVRFLACYGEDMSVLMSDEELEKATARSEFLGTDTEPDICRRKRLERNAEEKRYKAERAARKAKAKKVDSWGPAEPAVPSFLDRMGSSYV